MIDAQNGVLNFCHEDCSICDPFYDKVEALVKAYFPKLSIQKIPTSDHSDLRSKYQIFSAPVLLLLLEGKEYLRAGGTTSIAELRSKIERLYSLKFNN